MQEMDPGPAKILQEAEKGFTLKMPWPYEKAGG